MNSLSQRLAQIFRPERMAAFDPTAPTPLLAGYPMATQLLGVWNGWRQDRAAPERHDVDPLAMRRLLPNVFILDSLDGDDFRFRLVGDTVNARYDGRLKGRSLRQLLDGPTLDETLTEHRRCAVDLKGVFVRNGVDTATPDDLTVYGRLLLPVGVRDGVAGHILGIMEFPGIDA
jgi:hypothetical protein